MESRIDKYKKNYPNMGGIVYFITGKKNVSFLYIKNRSDRYQEKGKQMNQIEDTLSLIYELKKQGWKMAVISASKNCIPILEAVGISDWFDTVVEGVLSQELGIKGKPEPDIFFEAARRMEVTAKRAA